MNVLFTVILSILTASFSFGVSASGIDDLLRQGGGIVVDTQRNKASTTIDTERRKQMIDADAQRQIDNLEVLIDQNNQRISDEFEPQLMDFRVSLEVLERERANGEISRSEYLNNRRDVEYRISGLRNSITGLKRQNTEYIRREREIRDNAELQKKQADIDARGAAEQSTTRQNSNILDQIIRSLGR